MCAPCKDQLKLFQKVFDEYEEKGFTVFATALNNADADELREMGISCPVFIANPGVIRDYGDVKKVPRTFLIGRNGRVLKKTKEYYNETTLRRDIESALKNQA